MKHFIATLVLLSALAPALASAADCGGDKYRLDGTDAVIGVVKDVAPVFTTDGWVHGKLERNTVEIKEALRGSLSGRITVMTKPPVKPNEDTSGLAPTTVFLSFSQGQEVGLILPHNDMAVSDAYDLTYDRCGAAYLPPDELRKALAGTVRGNAIAAILEAMGAVLGISLAFYARRSKSKNRNAYIIGALTFCVVMGILAVTSGIMWLGNKYL